MVHPNRNMLLSVYIVIPELAATVSSPSAQHTHGMAGVGCQWIRSFYSYKRLSFRGSLSLSFFSLSLLNWRLFVLGAQPFLSMRWLWLTLIAWQPDSSLKNDGDMADTTGMALVPIIAAAYQPDEASIQQVQGIIGEMATREKIVQALATSRGDVQSALNSILTDMA